MVAVDGGADALIEAAATSPMPSSATWTRCPTRRCAAARNSSCTPTPTAARPGWPGSVISAWMAVTLPAPGTSEDVALLVADARGR